MALEIQGSVFLHQTSVSNSTNVKGDTHEDNYVMQKVFEKNGFRRCGIIYVEDGTPRIAYQREN